MTDIHSNMIFCFVGFLLSHIVNELRVIKNVCYLVKDIDNLLSGIDEEQIQNTSKLFEIITNLNELIEKHNREVVWFPFSKKLIPRLYVKRTNNVYEYNVEVFEEWVFQYYNSRYSINFLGLVKLFNIKKRNYYSEMKFIRNNGHLY